LDLNKLASTPWSYPPKKMKLLSKH
jgi:hypothetical protein